MSNYPNVVKGLFYKKREYGEPLCVFFKKGDINDDYYPFTTEWRSHQSAINMSKILFLSKEDVERWPEGDYAFLSKEEITAVKISLKGKPVYVDIDWIRTYIHKGKSKYIHPTILERMKETPQPNPFTKEQLDKREKKEEDKNEFIDWFKTTYGEAVVGHSDKWVGLNLKKLFPEIKLKWYHASGPSADIYFLTKPDGAEVETIHFYLDDIELFTDNEFYDKIAKISKLGSYKYLKDALNYDKTILSQVWTYENSVSIDDYGWGFRLEVRINQNSKRIDFYLNNLNGKRFGYKSAKIKIPEFINKFEEMFKSYFKSASFKEFENKVKAFDINILQENVHLYSEDVSRDSQPFSFSAPTVTENQVKEFSEYLLSQYETQLINEDISAILEDLYKNRWTIASKLKLNIRELSFSFLYSCFEEFDINLFDYDSPFLADVRLNNSSKEGYFLLPKKLFDNSSKVTITCYCANNIKIEEGVTELDVNNVKFNIYEATNIYLPSSLKFFDVKTVRDWGGVNSHVLKIFFTPVKDEKGNLMSSFSVNKWEIQEEGFKDCFAFEKKGK